MDTVKFVNCADKHLDAPIRDNGIGTYLILEEKIYGMLLRILDTVKQENAQLLLIKRGFFRAENNR